MSHDVEQKTELTCPACGHGNLDGWLVCASCHAPLRSKPVSTSEVEATNPIHHRTTNPLALASLACGIIGIFAPAGLMAIVLGHIAQIQIRRNRELYRGGDVAKLGAILGYVGVAVFAVLVLTLRYPSTLSRPTDSNEAARTASAGAEKNDPFYRAIRNRPAMSPAERENKGVALIEALQQAETSYKNTHPAAGYTCVLEDLFESGFDEKMLQLSIDTGYTLSITDCIPSAKGIRESFRVTATPPTGNGNMVCSDEKGVIRTSNAATTDACFDSGKPVAIR
jgi:hypothetical protein